jgi:hypothetical protein
MTRTIAVALALVACRSHASGDLELANAVRPPALAPAAESGGARTAPTLVEPGISLLGERTAPTVRLSLDEAKARRDSLKTPGGLGWTLRAFDDRELIFIEFKCRPLAPVDQAVLRSFCGEGADVHRRVRVERTPEALEALAVRDEILMHEGVCGIRVGTAAAELRERFGAPTSIVYPQAAGCTVEDYGEPSRGLSAEVCFDRVRAVRATHCPRSVR